MPSLEKRLGLPEGAFDNTLDGFNIFTEQAERVVREATEIGNVRNSNGKSIYYIDGIENAKKGVVVIMKDGKNQNYDAVFYTHELMEAELVASGIEQTVAHEMALQYYEVSPYSVYHPDVICMEPEWWNSAWFDYWDIER